LIERFNFYDLYGYLIPGAALIVMFALPFGLVHRMSIADWPILAIGIVAGYLLGHLLQAIASTAIPSSRGSERVFWRAHSATILNQSDSTFSAEQKDNIETMVKNWFNLDVNVQSDSDKHIGGVRQDAFFLCRRIANESSSYPEQFQGLYTMMRGLTVACWVGAAYTLGWAISLGAASQFAVTVAEVLAIVFLGAAIGALYMLVRTLGVGCWPGTAYTLLWLGLVFFAFIFDPAYIESLWQVLLAAVLLVGLYLSIYLVKEIGAKARERLNRYSLKLLAIAATIVGYLLGVRSRLSPDASYELAAIAVVYLAASFRFLNAYWFFAKEFAKAVWQHFAAGPATRPAIN
jgi:hypothetical protein